MGGHKEIDAVTGVETTGHVWDGDLKELNKPLPRWWLYVLYASIVWAIGYWILYPAWPLIDSHTKGMLGLQPARRACPGHRREQGKPGAVHRRHRGQACRGHREGSRT